MNVRLAAQLLSRSTAVAIRTFNTRLHPLWPTGVETEALDTADFVEKIDQLFDCLVSGRSLSV